MAESFQNWLKSLNCPQITGVEMGILSATNPKVNEVFQKVLYFFADPRTRDYLEGREKFRLEQATRLNTAREEGRKEGLEMARKQLLEEALVRDYIRFITIALHKRFGADDSLFTERLASKRREELDDLFGVALSVANLNEFLSYLV